MSASHLSPVELEQYSRHLKLPGFGMERQLKLKNARVLLVGAGGLGCPAGLYLAAAGVGTIGVVDFDRVERSNLQRQIAHSAATVGQPKTDSLIASMRAINPLVSYYSHGVRLDESNVSELIAEYDLVLDGSDNFATRFLLADACYLGGTPLLQAAVYEYSAQLALFEPQEGPCYRCVFREPPQHNQLAPCAEVGVLGVVPGAAGLMMATEAVKYLSGMPSALQGKLLLYDALTQTIRHMALSKDTDCPLCGENATITQARELRLTCPSQAENAGQELSFEEAQRLLAEEGAFLLDVRESFEFASGHIPGAFHLPLGLVKTEAAQSMLPSEIPVLAYCQKGQRSLEAVRVLKALGYERVYSLSGGIMAWQGPLETPV